ncbi:SET and MYND domain-containing protein 4 [Coccinella septempunctata]|uniref:SET and MYND domain-containing protein 4 n=1 Tax=Coccinella septempunctata TaxID=41139 RepID=UPI001D0674A4|nr:SET and MYND domain-containing protein 4 [Coccinella septempunctata]
MSQIYQDQNYATRCSEKTLQSDDEGFFLSLADNLAELAGNTWIEKCFGKLKNDREKLRSLYTHEPTKNALTEVLSNVQQIYRKKSSEIATARIKEAEELLEKNDLVKSLAFYSQAVLRSQLTGEFYIDKDSFSYTNTIHFLNLPFPGENKKIDEGNTLSLALFGRSGVLMDMNKYDFALADIQMALKENLAEHLKGDAYFKLAICYKALSEMQKATVALRLAQQLLNESNEVILKRFHNQSMAVEKFQHKITRKTDEPKLSGAPSKVFPSAVETLDLKETPIMGRHIVCKGKIKSGETLVVEPPYVACLVPEAYGTFCQHCFKRLVAPIGCPVCSNVAFCSLTCRNEALETYHKYECKILELLLGSGVSVLCHLALRMITQKKLEENMRLYQNRREEHVFSLCTNKQKRTAKDFFRRTVMAAFLLRCLQKVGYFNDENGSVVPNETETTVGEMLLFNLQMLQFNAHEIYEKIHPSTHRFKGAKINYIGVGLYPTVALFNHQCYPSVTRYFVGKNIVVNAIRPLNDGELVAENYGPVFTKKHLAARKNFLISRYWFDCQCPACVQNWPLFTLEKEDTTVRLRCPNKNCDNILSTMNETEKKCSQCNDVVKVEGIKKKLKDCLDQYHLALEKMHEMQPDDSIQILTRALDTFHEIAAPPHKETHLAEETLRACYADRGNTFQVPSKK